MANTTDGEVSSCSQLKPRTVEARYGWLSAHEEVSCFHYKATAFPPTTVDQVLSANVRTFAGGGAHDGGTPDAFSQ